MFDIPGGETFEIPLPAEFGDSFGTTINSRGEIVRFAYRLNTTFPADATVWQGFVYRDGVTTLLSVPGWHWLFPEAINNAGIITGYGLRVDGIRHAFVYDNGAVIDLGASGSDLEPLEAFSVNSSGDVVGGAFLRNHGITVGRGDEYGTWTGFVFSDGPSTDINEFIPAGVQASMSKASLINDVGVIAGTATIDNVQHLIVMTPAAMAPPRHRCHSPRWAQSPSEPRRFPGRRPQPRTTCSPSPMAALHRQR